MDEKPQPEDMEREPTVDDLEVPSEEADDVAGGRNLKLSDVDPRLGDHFK